MKQEGPHRQCSALVTWPRPSARAPAATLCAAPWSAAVPTMPPPQPLRTSSAPTSSLGWGQAPGSVGEGRPSARQAGACWTAAPALRGRARATCAWTLRPEPLPSPAPLGVFPVQSPASELGHSGASAGVPRLSLPPLPASGPSCPRAHAHLPALEPTIHPGAWATHPGCWEPTRP